MSARVSVTLDGSDGSAIAVKAATTPAEVEALASEAAQLSRASHPGVVGLVEHRVTEGGAELRTRFAGEPLDRWRGSLPQLAGLGAAIAATLADLHEMGIVHGRLDGSHVLVGRDGRPRLCGFSPHDGAQPPDDVAALARLLRTLAEQAPVSERRGLLAWRRGPLAERRAFEQVMAHAEDPVPRRRPSARALATALLAAVADAELPPAGIPEPPASTAQAPNQTARPTAASTTGRPPLPKRRPPRRTDRDQLSVAARAANPAVSGSPDAAGDQAPEQDRPLDTPTTATSGRPRLSDRRSPHHTDPDQLTGTAPGERTTPVIDGAEDGPGDGQALPAAVTPATERPPLPKRRPHRPADRDQLPGVADGGEPPTTAVRDTAGDASNLGTPGPAPTPADTSQGRDAERDRSDGSTGVDPASTRIDQLSGRPTPTVPGGRTGPGLPDGRIDVDDDARPAPTPPPSGPRDDSTRRSTDDRRTGSNASGSPTPGGSGQHGGGDRDGDRPGVGLAPLPRALGGTGAATVPRGASGRRAGFRRPVRPVGAGRRAVSREADPDEGVWLIGGDEDDTDPYDDVFGDQTEVGLDELFIDRPWPDRPLPVGRRRRRRPAAGGGRRLASRAAVLLATAAGFTGLLVWIGTPRPREATTEDPVAAPDPSAEVGDGCASVGAGPSDGAESRSGSGNGPTSAAGADVDGDGCPEPVNVEAGVVEVAGERWAIGRPDDRVALGDWDCDGIATPAVYRPATGDVFVFPAWAESGEPLTVQPVAQVQGGERLTTAPADGLGGRCDVPVVELPTGAHHTVEVTP